MWSPCAALSSTLGTQLNPSEVHSGWYDVHASDHRDADDGRLRRSGAGAGSADARPQGWRARARFQFARSARRDAIAEIDVRSERRGARVLSVGRLVTVLQNAARRAAGPPRSTHA